MKNSRFFISKLSSVLSLIVVIAITLTCTSLAHEVKANAAKEKVTYYLRGDVNMDGEVHAADARLALRGSIKLEDYAPGSPEFLRADFNGDGDLTAGDARAILRVAIGLTPDHGQIFNPELDDYYTLHPDDPDKPTTPDEPTDPDEPDDPIIDDGPSTITLSDGRVIPNNTPDWDKEFSYNGKTWNDYYTELIVTCGCDYDVFRSHYPNYSCGCKNHTCKTPLDHYNTVHDEILGCPLCGGHECPSIYSGNSEDCPMYAATHPYPDGYCQTCGKPEGDGTNGTCVHFLRDMECDICGQFVKAWTCHTCVGH